MAEHIRFSLVVHQHPKFAYQAWHLARSIQIHCNANESDIHLHFTREVSQDIEEIFRNGAYQTHRIERFGDGQWCNKLAQLPLLVDQPFDRVVLLDTDTILVDDLRPFFQRSALQAKVVDLANPSFETWQRILSAAGVGPCETVMTDASDESTILGNANGGLYSIPREMAESFSDEWRKWALWVLKNPELLVENGCSKLMHVDQISAALAIQTLKLPFSPAPANINYFLHFRGTHRYFDEQRPLALLHYHDASLSEFGRLVPPIHLNAVEAEAVERANRQIDEHPQPHLYEALHRAACP